MNIGGITRREALKRSAILLGGAVSVPVWVRCAGPDGQGAVREGGEADRLAGAHGGRPIGVQLYTVRDRMQRDVAATLESVAEIGYAEVETAGLFDLSPEQFRAAMDRVGLVSPAAHVPIQALRQQLDATLAAAETMGQHWVIVPWIDPSERTLEGYQGVAAELNRYGETARERGLRLGYHNHEFEFERVDGERTGLDVLLEETDPAVVDIELDLFWCVKGGHDPVALFQRHPGRFALCHVKDMADIGGAEEQTEVGDGEIDFAGIFAHAEHAGLRHFFVEHDEPADSIASIRTSYAHMRTLFS